ncbi:hypothetical protein M378DRAFT_154737, partial [Amanita muscaria Koide BX008]
MFYRIPAGITRPMDIVKASNVFTSARSLLRLWKKKMDSLLFASYRRFGGAGNHEETSFPCSY